MTIALLVIIVAAVFATTTLLTAKGNFYVGVTFGGNTTTDAKILVDKVKNYTNLFVLMSGPLLDNITAINEIGDYAVDSGLNVMLYFGTDKALLIKNWQDAYDGHWKASFLGVYFGDELGGKMLDNDRQFYDSPTQSSLLKFADDRISGYKIDPYTILTYYRDGTMKAEYAPNVASSTPQIDEYYTYTAYYLNGTAITTSMKTTGKGETTVTQEQNPPYTYQALWDARPFQTFDKAAQRVVHETNFVINRFGPKPNFTYLTSDYALYWFDYLGGYDMVLAQIGWNHTSNQDIGLVRGAASLQNKSWGTIITWKYTQAPYLASGTEVYDQMHLSYQCGAKYVLVFNYAENMTEPYGILQDEHFAALQHFWKDVVQNPFEHQGSIKAEAAFVLPQNYGWGMRNPNDTVWGLWQPPENYSQIWLNLQSALNRYGDKLDIVYDDPSYPASDQYTTVLYWNQTK
jgi:hypothetical protein